MYRYLSDDGRLVEVEGGADGGEEDVGAAPPHHGAQTLDVSRQAHWQAILHMEHGCDIHPYRTEGKTNSCATGYAMLPKRK